MGRAVGIDLGTTNSCVAMFDGSGDPQVLPSLSGERTVPSVVGISDNDERLVGTLARRQAVLNASRTVSSVKRLVGMRADDVTDADRSAFPQLQVTAAGLRLDVNGTVYAPEEFSAMILASMKRDAEEYLGETVTDAVITVPAYFNDAQRQATKDAGKIAGLNVLRIINEPTAAALAYGINSDEEQTILVFDLGGGTFDVSVLEIADGTFEVMATAGDNHLGGDDFDHAILEWMFAQIEQDTGVDLRADQQARQRLLEAAEMAKCELTGLPKASINLPFLAQGDTGAVHFSTDLTRAQLEQLVAPLLSRLDGPILQAIDDAGMSINDIDRLVLVGGMTRMPAVQERVRQLTKLTPSRNVNPDEVVALGAAIQAHIITSGDSGMVLLDVTPLSLGIETRGGLFNRLIPRNSTIPCRSTQVFTTAQDEQASVELHVLQGERDMAADNRTLGRLQLMGVVPAPRGVPQIQVEFDIDADGILSVHAIDLGTGHEQQARMDDHAGLGRDELERMIREAAVHAADDAQQRERAELRNHADSLLYSSQETIHHAGDLLPEPLRDRMLDGLASLRAAMHSGAPNDELLRACEEMVATSYEAADALYRSRAPQFNDTAATTVVIGPGTNSHTEPVPNAPTIDIADDTDVEFVFDDDSSDDGSDYGLSDDDGGRER